MNKENCALKLVDEIILYAKVSENTVCFIFIGGLDRQSVPKRWRTKFRSRRITQKKAYNIYNCFRPADCPVSVCDKLCGVCMRSLLAHTTNRRFGA